VKDKPIKLVRDIDPDLPAVRADAIRLRQVLLNLLSNAAKFTDQGEIVVRGGVQNGPTGRPELVISVHDTGTGIALEDQAKLFQAFSQVDDSPTRKTGGSGLAYPSPAIDPTAWRTNRCT
jgi:signal transduction histidine kinase